MKHSTLAVMAAGILALSSCTSSKTTLPYFTDLPMYGVEDMAVMSDYNTTIRPDDELYIAITSSVPEATVNYNLPLSAPANRGQMLEFASSRPQTYIVNTEGDIILPVIGKMHVAGMTTEEIQKKLTEIVRKDVSDALVRVELVNFQVVVAGEVNNPRTVSVNRNRFSVLDALSAAGDLTPYGERSNVLLIREEDGKRKLIRINLNSSEVLTSPYFYVRQNDYIYVEPNEIRQANARYNQDNAYKLTVISTVVSAASVIASLVIALTIK